MTDGSIDASGLAHQAVSGGLDRTPDTPFRRAVRRFRRHTLGMVGLALMAGLILAAGLAPVVGRYPPNRVDLLNTNAPPSAKHWLGTDRTGRDIWARTIHAGRSPSLTFTPSTLPSRTKSIRQ